MTRWLIPPFRQTILGVQWALYRAFRTWMDREPPTPPIPPYTAADRQWILHHHTLTRR